MITTAVIAFREFLEAFLIVGVFLGISKKLKIKKEVEIAIAAITGVILSFLLATITFIYGDSARGVLTEKNAELLESYLMIFSGFFLAYVVFSLHGVIRRGQGESIIEAHNKLQENTFDLSLFFTIVFLVFREGFEIALFTASTSLFSAFMQNMLGLIIGFASATALGILTFFAYIKFPIGKVFKVTEYMIILLGAALVQNGFTELFEHGFNIELSKILATPLNFLPDKHGVVGHFIRSFFGIDQEFSLARLGIMLVYVGIIYLIFLKRRKARHLF
ncbi:FTR1 family protein [Candidatus Roizmanbacteria bacterium]|nr:FTR1 family protein [Candidatus Roizmanbacteria bacterium]